MTAWLVGVVHAVLVAQGASGGVTGTIVDAASGAAVAGATVTLPELERIVVSDDRGRYAVHDVPAGPQHVSVRRLGFAPRVLHALVPRSGDVVIDIALERVPMRLRSVDVHPAVPVRGTDASERLGGFDRRVSQAALRNHPLLSEPDAFLASTGGNITASPESPSGLHVRGGASDETAFLIDGIPVLSPYHAAGTFSAWNPDALDRLSVSPPSPAEPGVDVLSGIVAATTREPGDRLSGVGSLSSTQARATVHGPLGFGGGGFLLSMRSGFPGFIAPKHEASYVGGTTNDGLLTVAFPVARGRARVLGYTSGNRLDASATARDSVAPFDTTRNAFDWTSRSVGAEWIRDLADATRLTVRAWRAASDADAQWAGDTGPEHLDAVRRDDGVVAMVDRAGETPSAAGVALRRTTTRYRLGPSDGGGDPYRLRSSLPLVTVFGRHERSLGGSMEALLAGSASTIDGHLFARSSVELRWATTPSMTLSTAYVHGHQSAQTLRNPESLVSTIFPVDLYVGAGSAGVPVARSDDVILGADYRPTDGVRIGAQVYARTMGGLVLVAPRTDEPFSRGAFVIGSGSSDGASLDVAARGARYGFVASYGWQRGRLEYRDSSFVPGYATAHLMETGVIVFPTATSSVRLGLTGAAGRRAARITGAFEWEACNLLDRGCEFGGSPRTASPALGAVSIPPYLRIDFGVRKHWHVDVGRHDALVALFGTVTNVLGRPNVLTLAVDPASGQPMPIGMRPLAPLVVGLDWQF